MTEEPMELQEEIGKIRFSHKKVVISFRPILKEATTPNQQYPSFSL